MSIFSKIGGALKGAIGGFITGGPLGAARGAIGGAIGGGRGRLPPPPGGVGTWSGGRSSNVRRVIPGVGSVVGAVAGYGASRMLEGGGQVIPYRRRSRGFSARDVRQAKRIMKMLKDVGAAAPKPRMVRVGGKSCD